MTRIKRLWLRRFKSFPQEKVDLENPTFLVGLNGSGKSNFADAFALLSEAMVLPLQAVFDMRGGISSVRYRGSAQSASSNLGIRIDVGSINGHIQNGYYGFEIKAVKEYGFQVVQERCVTENAGGRKHYFKRTDKGFESSVQGLHPSIESASLCLPVIGGAEQFAPIYKTIASIRNYAIQPARLREMQDPDGGGSLKADGANTASILQDLSRHEKDAMQRINELLSTIVPNTFGVKAKKHGNKLTLEFVQKWGGDGKNGSRKSVTFEGFNMSDGTLRAVGLLAAVFQSPKPSMIIIEEPEATIHPGALGAILDIIKLAAKDMQVIVTTHSPELLDAAWIRHEQIRVVTWRNGASRVLPPSQATREALKSHLMGAGELLRANALTAEPLFREPSIGVRESLFEDRE